jgi:hypothetical protein
MPFGMSDNNWFLRQLKGKRWPSSLTLLPREKGTFPKARLESKQLYTQRISKLNNMYHK